MRYAFTLVAIIATTAVTRSVAEEPKAPLSPDTMLHWLQIIDSDEYRLLQAVDQNGYYFAVKQDKDGDIVFCDYWYGPEKEKTGKSFELVVSNLKKEDLYDWDSKKSPATPTATISYTSSKKRGAVTLRSSVTIAYPRGGLT
jgi:hypothetical protein